MLARLVIPFFSLLLVCVETQEILAQEALGNNQRTMRKQNRQVPRHYICGAGTWHKRQVTPASHKCQRRMERRSRRKSQRKCVTKRHFYNWWWRDYQDCWDHWFDQWYDHWYDYCYPIPEVHHWTRINGLRFQYCHYLDWSNQFYLQEAGNYNWLGMKMCPPGMYVYGMRTKLSERDGLAGLILLCRNMKSPSSIAEVFVFDGEGGWRDVVASGNYAVGFRTRMRQPWIFGLKFQMAARPSIIAFNLKYQFPKNINATPIEIEEAFVNNLGQSPLTVQIQITKTKQFKRMWQNQNGYLNGQTINQLFSPSLQSSAIIHEPYITSKTIDQERKYEIQARRIMNFERFVFGRIDSKHVGQIQKDTVTVQSCTKYSLIQSVHISDINIPYILELTFYNGYSTENEKIGGVYKGASIGEVQTTANMKQICNLSW